MTREEAETIILKHQFAFASMPDDVIEAINYLVKEEPRWIPVRKIESIPYLMHKELDIPISECQKAYNVAIDYLRSQGKIKG